MRNLTDRELWYLMARETAPSILSEADRAVRLAVNDIFPEEWNHETGFDESKLPDLSLPQKRQLAQEIVNFEQGKGAPLPLLTRINNIFEQATENPLPGEKWIMGAGVLGMLAYHYGLLGFLHLGALEVLPGGEGGLRFGVGDEVRHLSDPHRSRGHIVGLDEEEPDQYYVQWYPQDTDVELHNAYSLVPYGYGGPRAAATVEDSEPANNFGFLKDPHDELYPAAWIGTRMREEARTAILDHVNKALAENGYPDAGKFINYSVYGSGASYNWDEDGDFDMQMWVDINKYNEGRSEEELMTEDDLVADIRRIVQLVNFPSFKELGLTEGCEGAMLVQYYAKPGEGTKEENLASKPYACFDLEKDIWYQKPEPITPEFYGEWFILLEPKAKDIAMQASAVLESLERNIVEWTFWSQMYERHQDQRFKEKAEQAREDAEADKEGAHNMFLNIFQGRAKAYSPEGEGNNDERDLMEKLLEVWGVFQRLRHAVKEALPWEAQELPEEPLPTEKDSKWEFVPQQRFYHLAPTTDRDRIQTHGLFPSKPWLNERWKWTPNPDDIWSEYLKKQPEGVYVTVNPEEYAGHLKGEQLDLWRIPDEQIQDIHPDPLVDHGYYITHPVQPILTRPYEEWSGTWPTEKDGHWHFVAHDATKVSEAVHTILSKGGGTFNMDLSEAHNTDGYYASVYGYEQQVSESDFGESTLNAYLDTVGAGHNDYLLGAWADEGLVYLDLTKHIPDRQTAIEFGLYNRQKAIWDIAHDKAIELDPINFQPPPAFSKVAAWKDLMEKAKRLKDQGRVHILNNQPDQVVGRVEGDHGTYTTQIWRQDPNSRAITMWDCECPWDQYAWQRTRQWKKYEGRPCSHVLALFWQAQQSPPAGISPDQMQIPGMEPQVPPAAEYAPGAPNLEGQGLPRPGTEPPPPPGPFYPNQAPGWSAPGTVPPGGPPVAPGQLPVAQPAPGMQIDPRVLRTAPGGPVDPRFQAPAAPGGNSQPQPPGEGGSFGFPGALSRVGMAEQTGDPTLDAALQEWANSEWREKWPVSWEGMHDQPDSLLPSQWDSPVPIQKFKHPGISDGMCWEMADSLAKFLNEKGFRAYTSDDVAIGAPTIENIDRFPWKGEESQAGDFGIDPSRLYEEDEFAPHNWTIVDMPTGTYGIDFTASQFGEKEFPLVQRFDDGKWRRKWTMRLAAFENGTIVRAEMPLVGMDRDGRQWRIPRNSKGEVLSGDEDKTIAIFPLSTGQLQPHLVRVVADTSSFSQSHGSPFIGT